MPVMQGGARWATVAAMVASMPAPVWLCLTLILGNRQEWYDENIGVQVLWLTHVLGTVIAVCGVGRLLASDVAAVVAVPLPVYGLFWLAGLIDPLAASAIIGTTAAMSFLISAGFFWFRASAVGSIVPAIAGSVIPVITVTLLLMFRGPVTSFLMP